jgi:hypothetical protein
MPALMTSSLAARDVSSNAFENGRTEERFRSLSRILM